MTAGGVDRCAMQRRPAGNAVHAPVFTGEQFFLRAGFPCCSSRRRRCQRAAYRADGGRPRAERCASEASANAGNVSVGGNCHVDRDRHRRRTGGVGQRASGNILLRPAMTRRSLSRSPPSLAVAAEHLNGPGTSRALIYSFDATTSFSGFTGWVACGPAASGSSSTRMRWRGFGSRASAIRNAGGRRRDADDIRTNGNPDLSFGRELRSIGSCNGGCGRR